MRKLRKVREVREVRGERDEKDERGRYISETKYCSVKLETPGLQLFSPEPVPCFEYTRKTMAIRWIQCVRGVI